MDSFNVIIADDHEIFRKGLAYTLKRTGLVEKIFHAGNGLEVLKLLNTNSNIHLVLMDIRMPEMDGIETTRQIRIQDNQTKILALSMMNDKATIKQMIKAGANGYLLKNTTKLELTDAIQELMKGHKYFSREVSDVLNSHIYQDQPLPQKPFHSSILSQSEKDVLILICHQYCVPRNIRNALFVGKNNRR